MTQPIPRTSAVERPVRDPTAPIVCEFEGVWFSYDGEPVVEDITFRVTRGEFAAVLGPNGSGKTTLLRLALGLLRPDRGSVRLLGRPAHRFREWGRVGYVPQQVAGLTERFPATVREIVAQGLYPGFTLTALFRRHDDRRVADALAQAGIESLANRPIASLSVGQRQRALIARAVVRQPEVLFLDEPVAGVDAAGREQFHDLITGLNREHGMTVFMISHDIGAVMREATTCACLNRSLVFHGPPHQLTGDHLAQAYGFPVDVLLHDALHEHR